MTGLSYLPFSLLEGSIERLSIFMLLRPGLTFQRVRGSADFLNFERVFMKAQILQFPTRSSRLQRVADNLWLMRLSDTPEAQAAADKLVKELRENNYVVPDYMKGE